MVNHMITCSLSLTLKCPKICLKLKISAVIKNKFNKYSIYLFSIFISLQKLKRHQCQIKIV